VAESVMRCGVWIALLSMVSPALGQEPAKRREWYLVSEPWCQYCPAAKDVFKAKGWPDENVITMDECERRFGFRPDKIPFEFGDPKWVSQAASKPVAKSDTQTSGFWPVSQQFGGPGRSVILGRSSRRRR
jgi:hypothetical protein